MTIMDVAVRTLDQVECELGEIQAAKAGLVARELRLLREADRMQAHAADGARTMADWAAARLDLAPETARTLVSTARGLESLPVLEQALEDGQLSYERTVELVRAVTCRVDVTDHWSFDVAGLRRVISKRRGRTRSGDFEAYDARYLVVQPSLERSLWRLHGQLAAADGAAVERALDTRADEMTERVAERPPLAQRRADALVDICESGGRSGSEPLISVFVDADVATVGGYLPAGPEAVDEAACLGSVEVIDVTDRAEPVNRGHKTRVIPGKLRRAVLHRDGGRCTVDGCTSRYRLQPHHVIPWTEHGPTSLDNLITLCWYHHHVVVHGQGRRLDPTSLPFRRRFIRDPTRSPPT
jgi:5-methylcytosine-specific restriction endonuclease McrA